MSNHNNVQLVINIIDDPFGFENSLRAGLENQGFKQKSCI